MRKLFLIIPILTLSGCTSNLSGFHPTMEADPAETGAEGFIYMNEMGKAYALTNSTDSPACKIVRESYQDHERYTIARYKTHPARGEKESARKEFECFAFKDNPTPLQIRSYVAAGFALSDLYCRTFFRRIALHSGTRNFGRATANDVGTAASALFGLAKAGSVATGIVGVAGGLADSAFRDYDASFLVSADIPTVQDAVLASQSQYATDYLSKTLPDNYLQASMAVQAHAYFCTFNGMKSLVAKAVKKDTDSKTDAPSNTSSQSAAGDERKQAKIIVAAYTTYSQSKKTAQDKATYDLATANALKSLQADEKSP